MKLESIPKKTVLEILEEFKAAPSDAWFGQDTIAVMQNRSIASVERDRWRGIGIPFVKCGRSVRYSKKSILQWLSDKSSVMSTTAAQMKNRG